MPLYLYPGSQEKDRTGICFARPLTGTMTIPEEVDIIICGGGSSGCVPAGRLANLDHNLSVLLIEAGESNLNNPW